MRREGVNYLATIIDRQSSLFAETRKQKRGAKHFSQAMVLKCSVIRLGSGDPFHFA